MTILGIDPGLGRCGYAVLTHEPRLVCHGVIQTPVKAPIPLRLAELRRDVVALLEEHQPPAAAVEGFIPHGRITTACMVAMARGVVMEALATCGLPPAAIATPLPQSVKRQVTGYGRAPKPDVRRAVERILGHPVTGPDDGVDAVAIALAVMLGADPVQA